MRKRQRGFTLVEVLITLSLMGVFGVVAYQVIGANFTFTVATQAANDNAARFDIALRMLREDVFNSSTVEMPRADVLRVHGPGKQLAEWHCEHGVLSRKLGTENRGWDVGHPVNLKLDGVVVLLTTDSAEPIAIAPLHVRSAGGPK